MSYFTIEFYTHAGCRATQEHVPASVCLAHYVDYVERELSRGFNLGSARIYNARSEVIHSTCFFAPAC
jgi:hypothetical protein